MEFEVSYSLDDPQQFWDEPNEVELDDLVSTRCQSHEAIDNALRSYLRFTTNFKEEYLQTEYDIARCACKLLESPLFLEHKEYVLRQIIYGILQEDDAPTLYILAAILLFGGRSDEKTFEMMQQEGVFPRLVQLIQNGGLTHDAALHRMFMVLLFEMSRMQRLTWEDLTAVDDAFILYLFDLIEQLSDDVNDPYHYSAIRVLLVLNEQYLVASTHAPLTNRIVKALSTHGSRYKTFGENLILLLNRETEMSLQLLILKLLYLVFSSPTTAEYFYTNDLYVLIDVILRNLLDLPADSAPAAALRHTYLRVLHPLLANSQIRREGLQYKKAEIRRLLRMLGEDANMGAGMHFAPTDETTVRLVKRCLDVPWLRDDESPVDVMDGSDDARATEGQKEVARRMLGMGVQEAGESALSVIAVAAHSEKPGVQTPSRHKAGAGMEIENT